jgi:hypothetical protein
MVVHSAAAVAQVDWGPVAVWVGALTTFLTVVVALLGGLGWFSLPRRPELRMTFEQAQPWCRQVGTGRDPESLWVRVAV